MLPTPSDPRPCGQFYHTLQLVQPGLHQGLLPHPSLHHPAAQSISISMQMSPSPCQNRLPPSALMSYDKGEGRDAKYGKRLRERGKQQAEDLGPDLHPSPESALPLKPFLGYFPLWLHLPSPGCRCKPSSWCSLCH